MSIIAPHKHAPLTQNYDKFLIGRTLTDRQINKYAKLGFYSTELMNMCNSTLNRPRVRYRTRTKLEDIMSSYDL